MPASVERALDSGLDKALSIQRPVVLAYLDRVRTKRPDATGAELVELLERRYRAAVVGLGAASGGAAAMPGVGTAASIATGAAEITGFVSATAMYVLALAEVHGVTVSDPDVRRALVLTTLVGETGVAAAEEGIGKHWATVLGRRGSDESLGGLNTRLGRLLITRFGARQGALLMGRAIPLGIGAGVGAVGNAALARAAISAARRTFGPPPDRVPRRIVDVDPSSVG